MKIQHSHRSKIYNHIQCRTDIYNTKFGSVTISDYCSWDGNEKKYKVTIESHELLLLAKKCLEAINSIAGTNYKVSQ